MITTCLENDLITNMFYRKRPPGPAILRRKKKENRTLAMVFPDYCDKIVTEKEHVHDACCIISREHSK